MAFANASMSNGGVPPNTSTATITTATSMVTSTNVSSSSTTAGRRRTTAISGATKFANVTNTSEQATTTAAFGGLLLTTTSCAPIALIEKETEPCCMPGSFMVGSTFTLMAIITFLLVVCCYCVMKTRTMAKAENDRLLKEFEARFERESRIQQTRVSNMTKPHLSYVVTPAQKRTLSHIKKSSGPVEVETSVPMTVGVVSYLAKNPLADDRATNQAANLDVMLTPQRFDGGES